MAGSRHLKLNPDKSSRACFARDGRPWALSEVNLVLRTEFNSYLEDADALSIYFFFQGERNFVPLATGQTAGSWARSLAWRCTTPVLATCRVSSRSSQPWGRSRRCRTSLVGRVQLEPSKKAGEVFAGVIIWAAPPNMEELRSRLRVSIRAKMAAATRKAEPSVTQDIPVHQWHHDVSLHAQWPSTLRPFPVGCKQGRRGGVRSGASVRSCPPDGSRLWRAPSWAGLQSQGGFFGCGGQARGTPGAACGGGGAAASGPGPNSRRPSWWTRARSRPRASGPDSRSRLQPPERHLFLSRRHLGRDGGRVGGEDQHFDDLAHQGRKVEPPTLVLSLRSGGQVWLSGLPTQNNLGDFPAVALQLTAFKQKPQERGGLVLPGVILVQMPITSRGPPSPRVSMAGMRCC